MSPHHRQRGKAWTQNQDSDSLAHCAIYLLRKMLNISLWFRNSNKELQLEVLFFFQVDFENTRLVIWIYLCFWKHKQNQSIFGGSSPHCKRRILKKNFFQELVSLESVVLGGPLSLTPGLITCISSQLSSLCHVGGLESAMVCEFTL